MLNKCEFIGNLGADPEIRTMQNGGKVANLSLGVTDRWKDKKTGERREETEWVKVVVFNPGLITICENYLQKGSKVYIEGALKTRSWESDGEKKYITEVVLKNFNGTIVMLDSRESGQSQDHSQPAPQVDEMEDEIPF